MRWNRGSRISPETCLHESRIGIVSVGVERQVCEVCGQVAFRYEPTLVGRVERTMFSRLADEPPAIPFPTPSAVPTAQRIAAVA
jgi:hypothetical protein